MPRVKAGSKAGTTEHHQQQDITSTPVETAPGAQNAGEPEYSLDDLLLPRTVINRIAKEALPPGSQLPQEGILALARSATVFINYLATEANLVTVGAGRKTVSAADVQQGLENSGFGMFVAPVRKELEKQEAVFARKKARKIAAKANQVAAGAGDAVHASEMQVDQPHPHSTQAVSHAGAGAAPAADHSSKRIKLEGNGAAAAAAAAPSVGSVEVIDVDADDDEDEPHGPTGFESIVVEEKSRLEASAEADDDTEPEVIETNVVAVDNDEGLDQDHDETPDAWEVKNVR